MLLGCIADDFTGASDIANTLTKGGMATELYAGLPTRGVVPNCEAGVVALKSRSIDKAGAIRQSLDTLQWLQSQGCRQILFKYCSTFNSTAEGNIGPVAEALLDALKASVSVICPAFPATGRTVFMGHLFVGDRLLSESGMEKHPLTPMTDPDIRRWLQRQTQLNVGFLDHRTVAKGAAAIRTAIDAEADAGHRLVVADAISDCDLLAIGEAIADHKLITGGSGIAMGLPENYRRAGLLRPDKSNFQPLRGPGVVLCGSCSQTSQRQVAAYLVDHPGLAIVPSELIDGRQTVEQALDFVLAHLDAEPLVYSTQNAADVADAQSHFGGNVLADRIEGFFGSLAALLVEKGVTRIAVGGGETSGVIVGALQAKVISIGPEIDPGIPALTVRGDKPLLLALKSGNFGAPDFFAKALRTLGQKS